MDVLLTDGRFALTGIVNETDVDVIRQLKMEIDLAEKHKAECLLKMNELCNKYFSEQLKNLQTISGVKQWSATAISTELGEDMKSFFTASASVSWCGLRSR